MKLLSGGQTGADRAGLDFASEVGIEAGGWCPKGRRAEDGPIPAKYALRETLESGYADRTRKNVNEADATVIFCAAGPLSGGSKLTVRCCLNAGKDHIVLRGFPNVSQDAADLTRFLERVRPQILNIAGNRESVTPGIYIHVRSVLRAAWEQKTPDV